MALSADLPSQAVVTASDLELTFPVLSDSPRRFIRDYNVLHPQEGIARPSLFILDRDGILHWDYVGMGAADRPPIAVVLDQLQAIQ